MPKVKTSPSAMIVRYDEQAKSFVSYCPVLDLYSQGKTRERAMTALCDTIVGWVIVSQMEGILSEALNVRIREGEKMQESECP